MEWIPTEEDMPLIQDDIIIHSKEWGVAFGFHCPINDSTEWFLRHRIAAGGGFIVKDITHWMKMPSTPEVYQHESDLANSDTKGSY